MKNNKFDFISIGSATHDIFVVSDEFQIISSPKFRTGKGECMALGTKIDVDKLFLSTGGGATNTAAAFAAFGLKAAAVALIGSDYAGREIKKELASFGANTNLIKTIDGGQTAYSILLTAKDGERTVLIFRGVSSKLSESNIPWKKLNASWLYVTSLGGNLKLMKKIISFAEANDINIAWNPGGSELKNGIKMLDPIIKRVSAMIMNREEATLLTGKKDIKQILNSIPSCECAIVAITDGENGSYAKMDGKIYHCKTSGVKSISRTGAGDAFGSGLIAGMSKTGDIKFSLRLATANAESVIQRIGAKKGILKKAPSEKELNEIKITTL